MIALNARFDGKVLVPDEPLQLLPNQHVRITVEPIETASHGKPPRTLGMQRGVVTYMSPDFAEPLADDIWDHNRDDQGSR